MGIQCNYQIGTPSFTKKLTNKNKHYQHSPHQAILIFRIHPIPQNIKQAEVIQHGRCESQPTSVYSTNSDHYVYEEMGGVAEKLEKDTVDHS